MLLRGALWDPQAWYSSGGCRWAALCSEGTEEEKGGDGKTRESLNKILCQITSGTGFLSL